MAGLRRTSADSMRILNLVPVGVSVGEFRLLCSYECVYREHGDTSGALLRVVDFQLWERLYRPFSNDALPSETKKITSMIFIPDAYLDFGLKRTMLKIAWVSSSLG